MGKNQNDGMTYFLSRAYEDNLRYAYPSGSPISFCKNERWPFGQWVETEEDEDLQLIISEQLALISSNDIVIVGDTVRDHEHRVKSFPFKMRLLVDKRYASTMLTQKLL